MDAQRRTSSDSKLSGDSAGPEGLPPAETPSVASKGMFMIALGIGLLGIITGIAGIYIANGASSELAAIKKQVSARPDPMESVKPVLQEMDERLAKVGTETMRANNGVRETNATLQRTAQSLSTEIRANRDQINKITAALADMSKPQKNTGDGARGSDSAEPAVNAAGQRIHVIQSGDIFSKLAKQYNVSVQAIIDANPGVDPTKLQIGQKIVIPASK
ncbi:MAG: LysM domain-containing protein [Opitutales bacterium]